MAYVNINTPSRPLRPAGLGALPRPVQRMRIKNLLPRGMGGLGYTIAAAPPYFTPDPEAYVTIAPTNGMAPFTVVSTESYLQKNLAGQMQNSAQYNGWSLAQWIAAITADAVQRCSFYPGSCGNSTPEQLGQKYGTIAYQIMQLKGSQAPSSPPTQTGAGPGGGGGLVSPVGSVSIVDDQTRSGSQMRVGDTFTLQITRAQPNAPVTVSVNGSVTQQGTTDASGNFTLRGTVPNSPGTQMQQWSVASTPTTPAQISFTIVAAPSSPANSPAGSTGPGASIPLVPFTTPAQSGAPGAGFDFSFLTNPVSLFGFGVPLWILLAAGGAGVYALSGSGGGGGRRR